MRVAELVHLALDRLDHLRVAMAEAGHRGAAGGEIRQVHLSNGVLLHSEQHANGASTTRDWRSPVLDDAPSMLLP